MPRLNRVDPWGDLHAVEGRGMFTGNRGCLVDGDREVVRHHRGSLWITCLTEFKGWRSPLADPHRWTPLFFLDDAVALAAGHRPCGLCRRDAYRSYQAAVADSLGAPQGPSAAELNRALASERLRPGRGLARRHDRRLWEAEGEFPDGTVIVDGGEPHLVLGDRMLAFTFDGWSAPARRRRGSRALVLTPPTSVAALRHGYQPMLHHSAVA